MQVQVEMADTLADKLSRISALRPAWRHGPAKTLSGIPESGPDRLAKLLNGEFRTNRLGRHMVVQSQFHGCRSATISPRALQRILPNGYERVLDPRRWLFLDTETTGLAGGTGTYAFLIGVAWWEEDRLAVEQYFMRDYIEEPSLLLALSGRLAERRVLVTIKGKSFDWPLLQTRYRITRAAPLADPDAHLDLLHPARQLWSLRLKSVALSELERRILGLERGHDIPSETIPQRYFEFLRGGPAEPIADVFRHNQMDLCGLAFLAIHLAGILNEPEKLQGHAEDLFGVSRLLRNRGEETLAGRICQKALDAGLPEAAERKAQRDLAFLAKRQRDFERSNALWQELVGETPDGLKAYEQLAIYYEHRVREPERAAAITRAALTDLREALHGGRISAYLYQQWHASLQHRLNRLLGKIK